MKQKIYVAGKMRGMPHNNHPAFYDAALLLRTMGHDPVNPAELDDAGNIEGWKWNDFMKRDLELLVHCNGIALLPGWEDSQGATVEAFIAVILGLDVYSGETGKIDRGVGLIQVIRALISKWMDKETV